MNIVVFGAAGNVGCRIVREGLARGHAVTGVVRTKAQVDKLPKLVRALAANVADSANLARALDGQDVAICALRPPNGQEDGLVALTEVVLDAAAEAGVRVLVAGGAGRLLVPGRNGETVLSAPDYLPPSVVPIARASQAQYERCLRESQANWTYLSPAAMLEPGERTGCYRFGDDTLVVDEQGISRISMEDFAVAILDEAENPGHVGHAFSVGY